MSILNYRNMFLFNAVIAVIYGVLFILIPKETLELNEFVYSIESDMLSRALGASMITIGVMMLVLSFSTDLNVLKYASIFAIIGHGTGAIAVLYGIYVNAVFSSNLVFMSNIIPYILFIIGFGYLYITKAYE
ncbi:MAG: hypothetical protein ACW981_15525 [Candidatus Hodarchaeales archaeon]